MPYSSAPVVRTWSAPIALACLLFAAGCGSGAPASAGPHGSGGSGGTEGGPPGGAGGGAGGSIVVPDAGPDAIGPQNKCGNGVVTGKEDCDDGNTKSGDGCSSTCQLEPGWVCPNPGAPCIAKQCGDGIIAGLEQCDDGNTADGDGCSSTCKLEPGWACTTTNGKSVCHQTVCGDGVKEGFEQCDDGNRIPYDGCSPTCTIEPACSNGQCTPLCGDGLKFPQEECDDGNTQNGDGCSSTCQIEKGWTCQVVTEAPPAQLVIPILYRDFLYYGTTSPGPGHPDFERYGGAATGLVKSALGNDGKPVFNSSTGSGSTVVITDATSFCWWYHESGCDPNDPGGANPYDKLVYTTDGTPTGPPTTLTLAQQAGGNTYQFSSTSFFPVDGLGWGNAQTYNGHNFSFTSELRYPFTYQGGEEFDFTGDDDVYVFINGQLAVDLGGVHGAESGSITLDATAAANLSLTVGDMYEIAVFQAERHTVASNYKLTLSNFVHAESQCKTTCGDGIVAGEEQCDDGTAKNTGGYGKCNADCTRGPFCGDGIVQAQYGEACDGQAGCGPNCQWATPH
jgi:fibro-slime domain-containing protein